MTLKDFTNEVHNLLNQLGEADAAMPPPERKREVCAAVWAAISASFESSALSPEEREKLSPLVQEILIPHWQMHCAKDADMAAFLASRSEEYLQGTDSRSHVATASSIVRRMLDEMGVVEQRKERLTKTLVPLFAHRMLGDSHYMNDVKGRFGIQLSMLAAIATSIGIAQACEPALKLFRIG